MTRPHIEFIQSADVDERDAADPLFTGARERRLSEDDETGAYTALVRLPAGWSRELGGLRPLELFALRGRATLAGQPFDEACYAFVPAGAADGTLAVAEEILLLAMVEAEATARPQAPIEVIDTETRRLDDHGVPGVPPGLVIKLLRVDPEASDWTWICAGAPGWQEDRAEIHPTVEEALVLRGDVLLGARGVMSSGCYFWRPPNVRHGPMFTRDGNLIFFRTKGGGMEVSWEAVPGWQAMVDEYKRGAPYYAAP